MFPPSASRHLDAIDRGVHGQETKSHETLDNGKKNYHIDGKDLAPNCLMAHWYYGVFTILAKIEDQLFVALSDS